MSTFILKPETLASFRQLLDYDVSLCSIFQFGESAGLSESEMQALIEQDVLDESGQITENASVAIQTLATADKYSRIRFAGYGNTVEYINYYSSKTEECTSTLNREEGFLVEQPVNAEEIVTGIGHYMGNSVLKSFDFDIVLDELTAYLLLGLIDMNRKNRLNIMIQGSGNNPLVVTTENLLHWMENVQDDAQWFSTILKDQMQKSYTLNTNLIQTAFDKLMNENIVIKAGTGYQLSNSALGFTNQFLVTENLLSLAMGQEANGEVYSSGFTVIQAGVNDLLYMDVKDGEVQLEVISSSLLGSYLKQFLINLEETEIAVEKPEEKLDITEESNTSEPVSEMKEACNKCGAKINEGQRFCHECGTVVEVKVEVLKCPACHEKIDGNMAFCTKCGQKLK